MTDLKLLTVRALRDLAKTHLGEGHSRLKTKAELIAALAKVMPDEEAPTKASKAKVTPKAVESAPASDPKRAPKGKAPAGTKEPARLEAIAAKYSSEPKAPAAPEAKPTPTAAPLPPPVLKSVETPLARVIQFPSAATPPPTSIANGASHARPAHSVPAPSEPTTAPPVEVVARPSVIAVKPAEPSVAGPSSATKAKADVVETPVPPPVHVPSADELALLAENLGDLPRTYGEDDVTLLARDPHTLWISWDFAGQTERRAHEGMAHATPVLRLFDGVRLVREVEISLEARSWYVYNVIPGHKYRAEIHYVARAGTSKQVGPASNPIGVPPEGPSPVLDTHFVALPPIAPLPRPPAPPPSPHLAPPFPAERRDELISIAEKMLRDELAPVAVPPPVPVAAAEPAAPADQVTSPPRVLGHEEVRTRTRWVGSSDQVTEHYRVWIPSENGEQPAAERTRFGGRWTSSRPA